MSTLIDEQAKETIRVLYPQGVSLTEIGAKLGVSKQVVRYHVQRMELAQPVDNERVELLELLDILLEENPTASVGFVSSELSIPTSKARSLLRSRGVYFKKEAFSATVDRNRLIKLYVVEDKSLSELTREFENVSPSTLSQTLKDLGIPVRPRGTAAGGEKREAWRQQAMRELGV